MILNYISIITYFPSLVDKNRNASPSISSDKKSTIVEAVDPATSTGESKLKPRSR